MSHVADENDKKALQYIRNAGDGATRANFEEDHEPIGVLLLRSLLGKGFIVEHVNGQLQITEAGDAVLKG